MNYIYQAGTFIAAKSDPGASLVIDGYMKRIYSKAADGPFGKLLAYFERELIPPL